MSLVFMSLFDPGRWEEFGILAEYRRIWGKREGLLDLRPHFGLAKKCVQVFPSCFTENPKQTFWPTQYLGFSDNKSFN